MTIKEEKELKQLERYTMMGHKIPSTIYKDDNNIQRKASRLNELRNKKKADIIATRMQLFYGIGGTH